MKERYHITGMTCSACSSHVEKSVNKLSGVERASVNLLTETMDIVYQEDVLTSDDIVKAVERAGYGASLIKGRIPTGIGSTALAKGTSLMTRTGSAAEKNTASVNRKETFNSRESLQKKSKEADKAMLWRLGLSIVFLIPLMYVAMYHMFPASDFMMKTFHGNENAMIFALTQFLLLLPILYINKKFFTVGFKTLLHFRPNMDSLIAMGASASTVYGIFAMYRIGYGLGHGDMALVEHYSHDLYFESAGMILTLITVGKYLEGRSKGKTSQAITKLMDLSPKMALVIDEKGKEKEIPTEEVQIGDIFLIKPGSFVPVDGVVLEGNSSIDESAITGESIPVEKKEGDKVVSATVNKAGFLKCRAEKVGEDTTLSQIIRLVEEASGSKAPIAQLADKVASIFVPVVIGIALLTLAIWLRVGAEPEFAISSAIAVLVISCPCALGLATPVAIMVGTGVGARHGILIKSGEALQRAKSVDTIVLDKTGTITEGKLTVKEIKIFDKTYTKEKLISLAAALEAKSEHPLAEAIVKASAGRESCVVVKDFKAVFGKGIQGTLKGNGLKEQTYYVGNQRFIEESLGGITACKVELPEKEIRTDYACDADKKVNLKKSDIINFDIRKKIKLKKTDATTSVSETPNISQKDIPEKLLKPEILKYLYRMADEGQTPLFIADETHILGMIGVADTIRESSKEAVEAWKHMGVHVVMLTGDNKRTAEAVKQQLKLSEVMAEVLPEDKEKKIRELKEAGHKVAMIGDGINDAPALAAADVGMAIGAGTDVAIESADIILMKNDLRDAVTAIRLSRDVIRNIKENLFWAFFYNSIGIPLAAGLFYPLFEIRLSPMFGAAAMSLSSIFVVTNALRLRSFRSIFHKTEEKGGESITVEENNLFQEEEAEIAIAEKSIIERKNEMTKVIIVEGMMCSHCTGRVQKVLEALDGVAEVVMSLEEKSATVKLTKEVPNETLTAVITDAGYEVKEIR